MKKNFFSNQHYKITMFALLVIFGLLDVWASVYWQKAGGPNIAGDLHVVLGVPDRNYLIPIEQLKAKSPLLQFGVKPGDHIRFEHFAQDARFLSVDEKISLKIYKNGNPAEFQSLVVTPSAKEVRHPLVWQAITLVQFATTLIALLIIGCIVWQHPGNISMRVLAFAMLAIIPDTFIPYLPGGSTQDFLQIYIFPLEIFVGYVFFTYFCLIFPEQRPHWRLPWVRYGFYLYASLFATYTLLSITNKLGILPWELRESLNFSVWHRLLAIASVILSLGALLMSWRFSSGITRQRLAWVGFCMGNIYAIYMFHNLFLIMDETQIAIYFEFFNSSIIFLSYYGLGYALLRNRLFDFSFAINRLGVYALTACGMLSALAGIELVFSSLVDARERWQTISFDIFSACLLLLMYKPLRSMAEKLVRTWFYPKWRAQAEALQSAVAHAANIMGQDALLDHYIKALSAYAGGACVAVYSNRDGVCAKIAGDLLHAPALVQARGGDLALMLLSKIPASLEGIGGENALLVPFTHRGQLTGFLLMGGKQDFNQYRPDEIKSIITTASLLDLDLQAEGRRIHQQSLAEKVAAELKAREIAESANEAKSSFLANMSHEIRTPMNAIIGLAYLALRTDLTHKQRDYLSNIHTAGTTLLGIINSILDFSKIEAGMMEIDFSPFSLDEVLRHLSTITSQKAQEKSLQLNFHVAEEIPRFLIGDALRLGQILINLVSNAIKFTEKGQVDLNIELYETVNTELNAIVNLQFTIRDSGIGMSEELLKRLFTAFTQADRSTSRQYGGTGLGLTISRQLVDLLGGTIEVQSQPGQGSSFTFTLPFTVCSKAQVQELGQSICVPENAYQQTLVLLVEDNPVNQQIAQELLATVGISVDIVSSGQAALKQLQSMPASNYDLILMDLEMPDMDGHQTTQAIRQLVQFKHIPIVAITAHAMSDVQHRCLAEGMQDFLPKPVQADELFKTLARWLKHKILPLPESPATDSASQTDLIDAKSSSNAGISFTQIDYRQGLQYMMGREEFYLKVMGIFQKSHLNTVLDLEHALAAQDWNKLILVSHNIKGAAASIAATQVREDANQLEHYLAEVMQEAGRLYAAQVTQVKDFTEQLSHSLTLLLAELDEKLPHFSEVTGEN